MIKNLLATIGLLIVLVFVGFAYLGTNIINFQDEHTPFVEQFMQDLSQNWQTSDVQSRLADSFIEQINTDDGRYLIRTLKSMGKYQSMSNVIASQYNSTSSGKTITINYTAHFSKGKAAMNIHLIEIDDDIQVNGLYMTPIGDKEPLPIEQHV